MERTSQSELVNRFFSGTGGSYDTVVNLGTFGSDRWWKRKILRCLPDSPGRILDQAAGTGILTYRIAATFPRCHVVGVELRREYLERALRKRVSLAAENVDFVQGRAEDVVLRGGIDAITSSYLAKYADLEPLVSHAREMLLRGGVIAIHDFTMPQRPLWAKIWEAHLGLMNRLGGGRFPEWREAFAGLPELIRRTTWVEDVVRLLHAGGFLDVSVQRLTFGSATLVSATKA